MWSDSFQVSLVKLILVLQAIWNVGNCNGKGLEELGEKLEERLNRLFHLEKEKQLSIYKVTDFLKKIPWNETRPEMGSPEPDTWWLQVCE